TNGLLQVNTATCDRKAVQYMETDRDKRDGSQHGSVPLITVSKIDKYPQRYPFHCCNTTTSLLLWNPETPNCR
ncbi:MAG: hypothetical protein J6D43_19215, partial [Pseudomonas sp.]|nr:hypothetical protein [Pseudomonas sp.]